MPTAEALVDNIVDAPVRLARSSALLVLLAQGLFQLRRGHRSVDGTIVSSRVQGDRWLGPATDCRRGGRWRLGAASASGRRSAWVAGIENERDAELALGLGSVVLAYAAVFARHTRAEHAGLVHGPRSILCSSAAPSLWLRHQFRREEGTSSRLNWCRSTVAETATVVARLVCLDLAIEGLGGTPRTRKRIGRFANPGKGEALSLDHLNLHWVDAPKTSLRFAKYFFYTGR